MHCGVGRRHSSDLSLWRRPVATALIPPLAWEPPYATGVAQEIAKRQKKKKRKKEKERKRKKIIYVDRQTDGGLACRTLLPRALLSCNWKFVPFEPLHPFVLPLHSLNHPLLHPQPLATTSLFSMSSVLWGFCWGWF